VGIKSKAKGKKKKEEKSTGPKDTDVRDKMTRMMNGSILKFTGVMRNTF